MLWHPLTGAYRAPAPSPTQRVPVLVGAPSGHPRRARKPTAKDTVLMQDELHQLLRALCQRDRGVKGDAATFLGLNKREAGKAADEGAAAPPPSLAEGPG